MLVLQVICFECITQIHFNKDLEEYSVLGTFLGLFDRHAQLKANYKLILKKRQALGTQTRFEEQH